MMSGFDGYEYYKYFVTMYKCVATLFIVGVFLCCISMMFSKRKKVYGGLFVVGLLLISTSIFFVSIVSNKQYSLNLVGEKICFEKVERINKEKLTVGDYSSYCPSVDYMYDGNKYRYKLFLKENGDVFCDYHSQNHVAGNNESVVFSDAVKDSQLYKIMRIVRVSSDALLIMAGAWIIFICMLYARKLLSKRSTFIALGLCCVLLDLIHMICAFTLFYLCAL